MLHFTTVEIYKRGVSVQTALKIKKDNKGGHLTQHFIHLVPDVSYVQSCEKEMTLKTAKLSQDSPGL